MVDTCSMTHPTMVGVQCGENPYDEHDIHVDHLVRIRWSTGDKDRDVLSVGNIGHHVQEFPDLRTGQLLYNFLPGWAAKHVVSTLFDPFHKQMPLHEVASWIDEHLIFDDKGRLIGVMHGEKILCQRIGA